MSTQVCEAWYSVEPKILEKLYHSIPRRTDDPYDLGVQVWCCVFIGMTSSMLLCYHWNVFNIYIHVQTMSDYTLICLIQAK